MRVEVKGRTILYIFSKDEVALLESLVVWETIKKRMWHHEEIKIE